MIILFIHKNTIYICNVGDSRAILGQTSSEKGKSLWKAIALSQDHKPELSKEKERIENKGGLVVLRKHSEKSQEPVRAWIPHNKAFGLSMSRSLGDLIAKKYGITWEPEIRKVEIGDSDKFLIIGSDGVWEIIENQEVFFFFYFSFSLFSLVCRTCRRILRYE